MAETDINSDGALREDSFDWKRLLLRKDRPLPKAGCSWAFYIALLLLIAYLSVIFIKYNN